MVITRKLKLTPTPEQKNILMETLLQHKLAVNTVLKTGYEQKTHSGSKLHNLTYYTLRETTNLPSQLVCSARNKACEALKSIKERDKWKCEQPQAHRFPVIRYDQNSCTFTDISIKLSTTQGRQNIPFIMYEYAKQHWKSLKTTCELQYKKSTNEWYIIAMYDVTPLPLTRGSKTLGIDRGIKHIAVLSNNTFIDSKHLRKVKGKYAYLRHKLAQKGTKSSLRLLRKLSGKEHRFVSDANHCISKHIANLPFDVFVLEQLTIRTKKRLGKSFNKRLMGWSWKQLEQFLTYKAELLGKRVEHVDARYTSQKCSVCGHVKRSNRTGTSFKCTQCGFQLHADLNASRNIRDNYISEALRATSSESRASSIVRTSQLVQASGS